MPPNPNPNGVTYVVEQMVGRVSDQIEALDRLNRAEFAGINSHLDPLKGLPLLTTGIIEHQKSVDRRVGALEEGARLASSRRWSMRASIPTTSLSFIATVTAVLAVVIK